MNQRLLDVALVGYNPDFWLNENGEPMGIYPSHIEVLKDYMDFIPVQKLDIQSFQAQTELVANGDCRLGTPKMVQSK